MSSHGLVRRLCRVRGAYLCRKGRPLSRLLKRVPCGSQGGTGFSVTQICAVASRNFLATAPTVQVLGAHVVEEVAVAFCAGKSVSKERPRR